LEAELTCDIKLLILFGGTCFSLSNQGEHSSQMPGSRPSKMSNLMSQVSSAADDGTRLQLANASAVPSHRSFLAAEFEHRTRFLNGRALVKMRFQQKIAVADVPTVSPVNSTRCYNCK
jgi:hypothetical protein